LPTMEPFEQVVTAVPTLEPTAKPSMVRMCTVYSV
jgi:hypothetical protein